jgi:hypothetical protein
MHSCQELFAQKDTILHCTDAIHWHSGVSNIPAASHGMLCHAVPCRAQPSTLCLTQISTPRQILLLET